MYIVYNVFTKIHEGHVKCIIRSVKRLVMTEYNCYFFLLRNQAK